MSRIISKSLLISLLVTITTTLALGQAKDNSPFAQFGLGEFINSDMSSSHSMGGLSAVYHDFFEANLENPASLGFLQYTSLQFGITAKRSSYNLNDAKQTIWNGNANHVSLNIPIINPLNQALERKETDFAWGMSFGVRPYAQAGYNIIVNETLDSLGDVQRNFTGSGGLYNLNWGNGFKYKNLAAGINLGYLRGQQSYGEQTYFLDLSNAYDDFFNSNSAYKGFQYRFGLMYEQPLDLKASRETDDKPSRLLSVGAYLSGQTNFTTSSDLSLLAVNALTGDIDTAFTAEGIKADGVIPKAFGIGFLYHHAGDFRAGVSFDASPWSQYKNPANPATMMNAWKLSFGGAWIPDAESITSYFKRVEYRAGFYTLKDPRVIEGHQVAERAFTFGASFPFILQRAITWVQVGFDVGKRTGGPNLTDNFVRGNVSFIFNDNAWFIKGKYD